MKTLTIEDIDTYSDAQTVQLGDGFTVTIQKERDEDCGPPWEECEGHGPVSEWTKRDKKPGERVLCSDRDNRRYYDFAAAMVEAKRDGWDTKPYKTGTKGERALRAVEADFNFLADWCADRWQYICIAVQLRASGHIIGRDSLCGVESCGDYWRETAAEMGNELMSAQRKELTECAYWAERDVLTLS